MTNSVCWQPRDVMQLASELLGHSDRASAREYYIPRNETVDPVTVELLVQAFMC